MCGRYASGQGTWEEYQLWLNLIPGHAPGNLPPRYNIAPTQQSLMCRLEGAGRILGDARWGLVPRWWRKPLKELKVSAFNARGEEAQDKPFFRASLRDRRCLAPAIGFYEWSGPKTARDPWFIHPLGAPRMCFAGLWDRAEIEGEPIESFTILTVPANADMAGLHDRMPVILDAADWDAWLDPRTPEAEVRSLITAGPEGRLGVHRVSRAVNTARVDGADLIASVQA